MLFIKKVYLKKYFKTLLFDLKLPAPSAVEAGKKIFNE